MKTDSEIQKNYPYKQIHHAYGHMGEERYPETRHCDFEPVGRTERLMKKIESFLEERE